MMQKLFWLGLVVGLICVLYGIFGTTDTIRFVGGGVFLMLGCIAQLVKRLLPQ